MRVNRAQVYAWGFALMIAACSVILAEGMRKIPDQYIIIAFSFTWVAIALFIIV